jgi:hypothetical protein
MGFVFFEERIKIDYVIRKNRNNNSLLIKLNSNFEFTNIYKCRLISKIVEFSKIDMSSDFEFRNIESIPKIVEFSKI